MEVARNRSDSSDSSGLQLNSRAATADNAGACADADPGVRKLQQLAGVRASTAEVVDADVESGVDCDSLASSLPSDSDDADDVVATS